MPYHHRTSPQSSSQLLHAVKRIRLHQSRWAIAALIISIVLLIITWNKYSHESPLSPNEFTVTLPTEGEDLYDYHQQLIDPHDNIIPILPSSPSSFASSSSLSSSSLASSSRSSSPRATLDLLFVAVGDPSRLVNGGYGTTESISSLHASLSRVIKDVLTYTNKPVRLHILIDHYTYQCFQTEEDAKKSHTQLFPLILDPVTSPPAGIEPILAAKPNAEFCATIKQNSRHLFDPDASSSPSSSPSSRKSTSYSVHLYSYHVFYSLHPTLQSLCAKFRQPFTSTACIFLTKTVAFQLLPDWVDEVIILDADLRIGGDVELLLKETTPSDEYNKALLHHHERKQSPDVPSMLTDAPASDSFDHPLIGLAVEQQLAHAAIFAFHAYTLARLRQPFSILDVPRGFNGGVQVQLLWRMRSSVQGEEYQRALKEFQVGFPFHVELGDQTLYSIMNLTQPQLFHTVRPEWNRQLCTIYWPKNLRHIGKIAFRYHKLNKSVLNWPMKPTSVSDVVECFTPSRSHLNDSRRIEIFHANCALDRKAAYPDELDGTIAQVRERYEATLEDRYIFAQLHDGSAEKW